MKINNRKVLFITLAVVFLGILLSIFINFLTNDPNVTKFLSENGIDTKTIIFIVVILVLLALLFAALQFRFGQSSTRTDENKVLEKDIEPNVESFFNSLKERYLNRYNQKLDGRFEINLEVTEDWNSQTFEGFKINLSTNTNVGKALEVINESFSEKGRLLIVGSPGAGKTVLLLKLALNLLGKVNLDEKEAFPVIFNLASWSSKNEKFEDWLIGTLNSGYGLSKEFAATLLHQQRIIFLLDGLDELARNEKEIIANDKRADFLKSLNKYLQRGQKAVICCRREEFEQMQKATGRDAPVSAKIEVLDLTKAEIISALMHAQNDEKSRVSANNLLQIVDRNEIFLMVISTPFYFTTALEVFDQQIVDEINFPRGESELKKYLINKFVEIKLERTPNPNSFEHEKTWKWLKWLAQGMEKGQLIVFELACLEPTDLFKKWLYGLIYGAVTGFIIAGIVSLFAISLLSEISNIFTALKISLIVFFLVGLFSGLLLTIIFNFEPSRRSTEDIIKFDFSKLLSWKSWLPIIALSLSLGVFGGITFGLVLGVSASIDTALLIGLFCVLFFGFNHIKSFNEFVYLESPYQRIYGGFITNLVFSILIVLILLTYGIFFKFNLFTGNTKILNIPDYKFQIIFYSNLITISLFSLVTLILTPLYRHLILRLALYFEDSMPLKYATFLDYASEARILEKDGGQWRFRHQNLQEYFTNLD